MSVFRNLWEAKKELTIHTLWFDKKLLLGLLLKVADSTGVLTHVMPTPVKMIRGDSCFQRTFCHRLVYMFKGTESQSIWLL